MSSDLRDANQALPNPMSVQDKMRMFDLLANQIGFKEIEISFPSAFDVELEFTRRLIEEGHIPHHVTPVVLTQAKPKLIEKTMAALYGTEKAIFHFYVASSEVFQNKVFRKTPREVLQMAVDSTRQIKELAAKSRGTKTMLEFSLEHFSDSSLDFCKALADAVVKEWGGTPDNKVIINLPATVEVAGPNVYADMIEWMSRHIDNRESVIISLHPHNDRGCAVAAVEQGLLAGADRVEGVLFTGGERTGNADISTIALNMYTQGVHPDLDFSDMPMIIDTWQHCTKTTIPPRHPYAGDLVYTAFSGSHQDAIKKGLDAYQIGHIWDVPYMPIDPSDIGMAYQPIRINSQSGKAAAKHVTENHMGLSLPDHMLADYAARLQRQADQTGKEVSISAAKKLLASAYINPPGSLEYVTHQTSRRATRGKVTAQISLRAPDGSPIHARGSGVGPVDGVFNAFGLRDVGIKQSQHSIGKEGPDAKAASFIEMTIKDTKERFYGIGIDKGTDAANVRAALGAINNAVRAGAVSWPAAIKRQLGPALV
jgi:2-isopropylmalate synthase